jgi:hypothetical protein
MNQVELSELIDELIDRLAVNMRTNDGKSSLHTVVSDLLRLMEAKKELEPDRAREVIVKWIESNDQTSSNA